MNENQPKVDQKRFVLAMLLSGIVLVIWQLFFAPDPPPPPSLTDDDEVTSTREGGEAADRERREADVRVDAADDQPAVAMEAVEPTEDIPVSTHSLTTDHFEVELSNDGGRVISTKILEPEQYRAEENLFKGFPQGSRYFPFAVAFADDAITLPSKAVYQFVEAESERATTGADGGDAGWHKVAYRYVDPKQRFQITKTYALDLENPYSLDLQVAVTNLMAEGRISDQLALDIFGYKDPEEESSFLDMMPDQIEGLCQTTDDIEREVYGSVESPLSFEEFETVWGGLDSRYFVFAAAPAKPAVSCQMERVSENYLRTRLVQGEFSVGPGETYAMDYDVFIGPKDYGVLDNLEPSMGAAVDYGFWTFLAVPLRWFLVYVYGLVGNWGLAIILMTLVIRLLLWPINQKVYGNGERMKEVQPELTKVREKYKNDQQKMTEETMRLFKENKVSPLGCAPMLLQFPILLALYYMILNSVELYQADFALWYTDLSAPDPYFVLPVLMGVVMFVQQSFMTIETPNPQMKTIMKIMPVTFTAFMLFLPSGVVLYYFVSLLLGLGQQWWIKKQFADKKAAAAS